MEIKSNGLLKMIVPVALFAAVAIGVKSCGRQTQPVQNDTANVVADLTQEELKLLGIEGDTPQDTLRTLVGRIKAIQAQQDQLAGQNSALRDENSRLKGQDINLDNRIDSAIEAFKEEHRLSQQNLQNEQLQLKALLDKLSETTTPPVQRPTSAFGDLPVGLGLEGGESQGQLNIQWIEPEDALPVDRTGKPLSGSASGSGKTQFPTSFSSLNDNEINRQKAELDRVAKNQNPIEEGAQPVYTLPENATLVGSQGMTALLGRVPIDGKVTDPYPFKVLIGKDNLTANGIELPEVEGAVVSGTATGDWVLSCVRGDVHSITFVFSDGTVRTVPKPAKSTEGKSSSNNGSIGWLSDRNGIPCLSGTRKTNAATYLPTLFALSASGAAADSMANNQLTTTVDGTSITSTLTGSAGQAALGRALSGGTNDVAEWVKARYGQMFDAVYVPPGAQVAVHITRQIPIDYEEQGRKVKYDIDIIQQNALD